MNPITPVTFVEQFHLLFLAQLGRRVNPSLFVLKGGCNLRFFHKSIRYSEGMDLDLGEISVDAFRDKVRELLASRPFGQTLEARGIEVARVTEPKQTDTTQWWKFGLRVQSIPIALPTKIECSHRGLDDGVMFGSIGAPIARTYQLPPLMLSHYGAEAALGQKIGALAGRRQTQARDVFDAHHLIASGATVDVKALEPAVAERASANALRVDFGMFKGQVFAFLPPEEQLRFGSQLVWDTMVLELVEALRAGRS